MYKIIWFIIIVVVGGGLFGWYYTFRLNNDIVSHPLEITHTIDRLDDIKEDICVINVMTPQPGDIVGTSFEVSGEASDCIEWGGVDVYDDHDKVVSAFAITVETREDNMMLDFFVQPELRFHPETETGYIEVFSADETVRQRVNIRFEEHVEIVD